jgi:hypothetical protein
LATTVSFQNPTAGNNGLVFTGSTMIRFAMTSSTALTSNAFKVGLSEYGSAPTQRLLLISSNACAQSATDTGVVGWSSGTTVGVNFIVGMTYPGYATLQPGVVYYAIVLNRNTTGGSTCGATTNCSAVFNYSKF